jgi:hypothetical protein
VLGKSDLPVHDEDPSLLIGLCRYPSGRFEHRCYSKARDLTIAGDARATSSIFTSRANVTEEHPAWVVQLSTTTTMEMTYGRVRKRPPNVASATRDAILSLRGTMASVSSSK